MNNLINKVQQYREHSKHFTIDGKLTVL